MKRLIWVILFTFYTIVLSAKVYDLVNPSGKLKLQIEVLDNISWTLLVNNDEVLSDNRVSMSLADGRILGNSPKVKEVSYKTMSENYFSILSSSINCIDLQCNDSSFSGQLLIRV